MYFTSIVSNFYYMQNNEKYSIICGKIETNVRRKKAELSFNNWYKFSLLYLETQSWTFFHIKTDTRSYLISEQ